MDLAAFGLARVEVFVLVLVRVAGIFSLIPIFGSAQVPVQVRVAVALALTLVFAPMSMSAANTLLALDVLPMMLLIVKEAMVGFVIGFVTNLIFAAIQAAGDFIDMNVGFSFASMFDPAFDSQTAIAGRLHHIIAGLLFFVTNAHHILLSGLADSFRAIPVGQVSLNPMVASGAVDMVSMLFTVAVRISAPIVVAVFLSDVALSVVSKAVPQMNIFMVGLPLKLGIGIVGMLIALPVSIALSRETLASIYPHTSTILRMLAVR